MSEFTPNPDLVVEALRNALDYGELGRGTYERVTTALPHAEAIAEEWEHHKRDEATTLALRELDVRELIAAAREGLALASVANEGDPWFAENTGIDTNTVLDRLRAALQAFETVTA